MCMLERRISNRSTRFITDVCIDYVYIKGTFHDEVNSVFVLLLKCKFCSEQYAKFQRHGIAIGVTKAITSIVDIIV